MRRKNGTALVKNEEMILTAALSLHNAGINAFHGYRLNTYLKDEYGKKMVASTLYRILKRLEERQLLKSEWEQAPQTDQWRCVFALTGAGFAAAAEATGEPQPSAINISQA